jgi:GT2 family glycosyltransferase
MELCTGWLEKALEVVQNTPDAGAVTGRVLDISPNANQKMVPVEPPFSGSVKEVRHGGGAALYRRSVLEEVGPFNPYLNSDEEPELCLRIRRQGYRVLCLDYPIAYHYSSPRRALSTLVSRRQRHLYLGYGQAIRYHWGTNLLWPYLKERGFALVPGIWIVIGVVILIGSLISSQWVWFAGWLLLSCAVVLGDAIRKRSLYQAIFSLAHRLFISEVSHE